MPARRKAARAHPGTLRPPRLALRLKGVTTVTNVFAAPHKGNAHEQVVFCQDEASGLRAIIAIYSTALGSVLGGTRFYPYGSADDALADVLTLSRAMAYQKALRGLDL